MFLQPGKRADAPGEAGADPRPHGDGHHPALRLRPGVPGRSCPGHRPQRPGARDLFAALLPLLPRRSRTHRFLHHGVRRHAQRRERAGGPAAGQPGPAGAPLFSRRRSFRDRLELPVHRPGRGRPARGAHAAGGDPSRQVAEQRRQQGRHGGPLLPLPLPGRRRRHRGLRGADHGADRRPALRRLPGRAGDDGVP